MSRIAKVFLFVVAFGFYSCEKVIDIKLKDSETKYVVEGEITNEPGGCRVSITQTKNFTEDNHFAGVSGATVTIKDNGAVISLTETQPGVYQATQVKGIPGNVYELTVSVGDQIFTATCTMPQPVDMDTLYISEGPFGQFRFATVRYNDPAGVNNGYRFVQYLNSVKDPEIFWENDEFTDGLSIITQLDTGIDEEDDPRNIESGDEVTVEMFSLDEVIYKYWYSIRSGGGDGNGGTAAPANPLTNIKGGALGYFSAHSIDRKTIIAP